MMLRHKLIGAFLLLAVLFLVYFYYLDRSQYLKRQIRQTSQEIEYLSNMNNHYLRVLTEQRQLAQKNQTSDIVYVTFSEQDLEASTLEAHVWESSSGVRRHLSSLLFTQ